MAEFDKDNNDRNNEIFSIPIRAGKRTYFFDVKSTRSDELYLTITESKRRFSNETGKFFYEKHKLFLYKEDFEKFADGLKDTVRFIETGEKPVLAEVQEDMDLKSSDLDLGSLSDPEIHVDVTFEDLDNTD